MSVKTIFLVIILILVAIPLLQGCMSPVITGKVESVSRASITFPDDVNITLSLQNTGGSLPSFFYKEGKGLAVQVKSTDFDVIAISPSSLDLIKGNLARQVNISLKTKPSASAGQSSVDFYYTFEGSPKKLSSQQIMISKPKLSLIVPPQISIKSEKRIPIEITIKNDEMLSQTDLALAIDTNLESEESFKISSGTSDILKGSPRYENGSWFVSLDKIQRGEVKIPFEMEVKSPVKGQPVSFTAKWSLLRKEILLTSPIEQSVTILPS